MKNLNLKNNNQKGFSILMVLLVVVGIVVAISAWALSGASDNSSSQSSTNKIAAATIANDVSSIQTAFSIKSMTLSKESITFIPNTDNTNSLLNNIDGISQLRAPANAIRKNANAPDGLYVYVREFYKTSGLNKKRAIVLTGVKTEVCKQINLNLNGTENIPSYISATKSSDLSVGATQATPETTAPIDLDNNGIKENHYAYGWNAGCVTSSNPEDHNIFFKILG